jgi:hypothetical protein
MIDKNPEHPTDVINLVYPQLDFLAGMLASLPDWELTGDSLAGLSSILTNISNQLQTAIREVPKDDNP